MAAGSQQAIRDYIRERIAIEDRGYATPCWIWQLSLNHGGYGQGHAPGTPRVDTAHRFSYRAFVGDIPVGLHLDHLCRVRSCCNPQHLEPVTPQENARRALPYMAWQKQTHCKNGHELAGDNLYLTRKGERRCRECNREWQRKRYALLGDGHGSPRKPTVMQGTHCRNGHALTPENTINWKGRLRCRACNIEWRAKNDDHRARHRMARIRKAATRGSGGDESQTRSGEFAQKDVIARRHAAGTTR